MKRALIAGGLLVGLVVLVSPAAAQTGTARGKVVDSEGNGIPEAKVQLEFQGGVTRNYELTTNKKGDYIQVGLYPGPYRFTASKEGYRPAYVEYRVNLGDRTQIPDITLRTMDEVAKAQGQPTQELRKKFADAVQLANDNRFDEAEALFKEILTEAPDVPEIYQNLAYIYVKRQDWANAEKSYLKALELRPGDAQSTSGLAGVYMQTGQQEKAEELVNQAAGENPEDATAQYNRGVFLVNNGKTEEAIAAFEAALAADPTLAEAHYHLGTLLVGQGKIPEAIEQLEAYLSSNPSDEQNVATAKGLIEALKK
jgi:tetratricopeptide (TPR) repeat protein